MKTQVQQPAAAGELANLRSPHARRVAKIAIPLTALLATLAFSAPSASAAASPWWHLASSSAPAQLQGGLAKAEVQEVTVSATEGAFYLIKSRIPKLEFKAFAWNASAKTVEEGLEALYGKGAVEVSGGPGASPGSPGEENWTYLVTFKGGLTDQSVAPMETLVGLGCAKATGGGCTGQATVTQKAEGRPDGHLVVTATNLGDADLDASGLFSPVTIVDTLPAGLIAVSAHGLSGWEESSVQRGPVTCAVEGPRSVKCVYEGTLPPFESAEVEIGVVLDGAKSGEENEVALSGGNAPSPAPLTRPIAVGGETRFGVETYELLPEEVGGALETQAGKHPFQLTSVLDLNRGEQPSRPPGLVKDLDFRLPPGLVGNPTPFPRCTEAQFTTEPHAAGANVCPNKTAVGVAAITYRLGTHVFDELVPLFNLVPSGGEPARFGFSIQGKRVYLDTAVRTGENYGVTVRVQNITPEATFIASRVTFWGTPGAASHDNARGWSCVGDGARAKEAEEIGVGPCSPAAEQSPPPLLSLPTSCTGPLQSTVQADSWQNQALEEPVAPATPLPALDGCNSLPFNPEITVAPDSEEASTPSGLTVDVHVPQQLVTDAGALAESTVRDTTVALPKELTLNAGGADGLQACSEAQVGYEGREVPGEAASEAFSPALPEPFCPDAAKIATVNITTPLLPNPLTGAVYLATPAPAGEAGNNPFHALVAMYIVAEDKVSGTLVKLPGYVTLDPNTGQLTATFDDTPQLPFEDLTLHFFGGGRAPLATPALCKTYETTASFTPWSGNPPATASSDFKITSGPNGGPCADPRPFAPEFQTGTTNVQAGGYSELLTTIGRPDADQTLGGLQVKMPPGLLGMLSSVKLCEGPQAAQGTCGPESEIGHTVVTAGLGSDPVVVKRPGAVYITGPYKGAPYGLTIVNPAEAGPFNLGNVIVRAKIEVNPETAQLTITSDSLPTIIKGVPLNLQHVQVAIDRPGFTFNPTDCEPLSVGATLSSSEGGSDSVSSPFAVTNCAALEFKPQFAASTSGKTSKADGASLSAKVTYPSGSMGTQANIKLVKVELPKQLPSRLTTLQKACTAAQFDANPAGCPAASVIGHAIVHTQVLPVPLEGPVYFVSHGGEAFPSLTIVLQGYGVKVDLVGTTFISKSGITSTTFKAVPDVPFETFELTLPEGKYSALAANGNLCKPTTTKTVKKKVTVKVHGHKKTETRKVKETVASSLQMPTEFVAQNGAVIKQATPIGVTGCVKAKPKPAKKGSKSKRGKGKHK
jgi:hypothetical protein